jgi:uncharacterized protein YdeI (YjbR/CyaY-like superfamily)
MDRSTVATESSPAVAPAPELARLQCADAAGWERWLEAEHDRSPGVWLELPRKAARSTQACLTYAAALEIAICFGWIDGQRRPGDDRFWLQRFTPRGPRSKWSQVNRDKATALIAAGRMREAGHRQVLAAQDDGRWEAAYEPQSRATVPEDLQRALEAEPEALAFFVTLTGVRRYAFLYRLHHVRSPDARARRIAAYIELLRDHRILN